MKKLLLLALLLCGISQAWADTWTDGNGIVWSFNVEGGNATDIYPFYYPSGNVVIPEKVRYGGRYLTVKSIGRRAFQNNYNMTSVTIPSSVTSIGRNAFEGCSSLQKVIVPDIAAWCGIDFEDDYANPLYCAKHIYSDENTEIKYLTIPEGVTSIGGSAFMY